MNLKDASDSNVRGCGRFEKESMLEHLKLPVGDEGRWGELCVVPGARGVIVFAHCNGHARESLRSAQVANRFQQCGFGTLVFDLLTARELDDPHRPADIALLTARLEQAIDALPEALHGLPLGLFGSGTGSAAALTFAAQHPLRVAAVVSRGGRPDLASDVLASVASPTLLIVGALDTDVADLNRRALAQITCERRIELVARATHLFLEAGALDTVALRACDWFAAHLSRR
jgi:pimeloyl-ACP methyl ester carboxylesterase